MTSVDLADRSERVLLDRLEGYYDAVPRPSARVEDFGPLTLFVREGEGWPFYARPARGRSGGVSAADVARVRARQRELGIPESFEWIAETTPALRAAIEDSGLEVHEHPLMVLDPSAPVPAAHELPGGLRVRTLGPDDPALASALAVPHLAFAEPGTGIGSAGVTELAEAVRGLARDGSVERAVARIEAGLTSIAAAVESSGTVLCAGQHQPVGSVSEIVGVGTLPASRRRGLGIAVTKALVADARARGVETVFLSAGDDDVARIYARLGFRRVATALIAEPAE
ncbi:GNAT family N-acetyltransferase [Streptomyces candidus]|uniref:N-acetylglutamate synthase-like GNAT family acetyltransferase n=1 Tax=Streptomyces candidus TaxID=67283 RepID=A0A7X0HJ47_9ACTN|nr:GNAT family N-acetyltransferase [Streptomyces candidus]MBB6438566.1 N-acetylglutamate synthase-like GNAT family acetyltransferase [Streptomyces candidus]